MVDVFGLLLLVMDFVGGGGVLGVFVFRGTGRWSGGGGTEVFAVFLLQSILPRV